MAADNAVVRASKGVWYFVAMRPRLKMTLIILAGSIIGLYLIAALVVLNLDAETVRDKLTQAARQQGMELSIGQLDLSFPFAVTMESVRLEDRTGNTTIELDRLRASIAVWRFMILKPTFQFKASSGEGHLRLDITPSLFSAGVTLRAEAVDFPIDHVAMKVAGNPLPIAAKLDGYAGFTFFSISPSALEGHADFQLNGLRVKTGGQWAAFLAGFTPKEARCVITAGGKRLATQECGVATNMGNMELRAGATLKDAIGNSPLEGSVVFGPQGSLTGALEALYGKSRKADGKYYFPVRGTLAAPALNL